MENSIEELIEPTMTIQQPPTDADIQNILSALEDLLFDKTAPTPSPESAYASGKTASESDQTKTSWDRSATLLDMAAHDLRSPLSAIILYVEHLLKGEGGPLNDEQARILYVITENTKRLANFINNIIDLHNITRGGLKFSRSPQHLQDIVSEIVGVYQVVAERAGVQLHLQIPENLPPVWANGPKIEQVVINLVSNALKFTPKGGQVNVRLELMDDRNIQCSIQDTGPGIAHEDLTELFKNYSEIDMERHHRIVHGTGLGLLISKEIINVHEGKIWAESWPERGSVFYFSLPQPPSGAA